MLTWSWGFFIDGDIVLVSWQDDVFVVEGTVLTVDGHQGRRWDIVGKLTFQLWNVRDDIVVSTVDTGTEDDTHLGFTIGVQGGNQSTGSVVDQSDNVNWQVSLFDLLLQHWDNIVAFNVWDVETLGPSLQDTLVDLVLGSWEGESETQWQSLVATLWELLLDEGLQGISDEAPDFFWVLGGSHRTRQLVLGLSGVESTVTT